MEKNHNWHPILEGDLADQARRSVEEIAQALGDLASNPPDQNPDAPMRYRTPFSLAGGSSGQALFFAYLASAWPDQGYDEKAMELLERSIGEMGESQSPPGLYSGFSGVAWAVEHLQGRLIDSEDEDPGEEIATALAEHLGRSPWYGDYDLISGLTGFGVYAVERLPRPLGRECVERTLDRLAELAEETPQGLTWKTPPELMIPQTREQFPEGNYNVGVAHGVPGVVGWLAEVVAAGVAPEQARRLLTGAVEWVLAQKLPPDKGSVFPYSVARGLEPGPSRLAWCYGDLGIAAALLAAARAAGEPAWEREALEAARAAAVRPPDTAGVVDAGLCHGAAGNAHIFNRLYQASGDPALAEAARFWFERTLSLRTDQGLAGFQAYVPGEQGELTWRGDPGFLTGIAGIGLSLLGGITAVEPDWDRVLVTSVPPRD